ncbi:MAG: glycosyltransferase [Pseudomonadota bacterium]
MKQRLADNISLVAQSPGLARDAVNVVVTIPTFRRPDHLLATLQSIKAQRTSRNVAIIVMENEAEARDGATAAAPLFDDGIFNGQVIIAHDRGNCNAYNAGWFTALTQYPNFQYLCVIDDDELADINWIEQACSASEFYGADLVGGPQVPVFSGEPDMRWRSHPVFAPHYANSGLVPVIYSSGNLLIKRQVLSAMPQPFLDLAFNFTGGGDADFIRRAIKAGFKTAWCNEAIVRETIPENRVTWDWIQKRALRNGELSARIEHRDRAGQPFGRLVTIARTAALLALSPFRSIAHFARSGAILNALYPVHVALGRAMSEFGYANEQYRNPSD